MPKEAATGAIWVSVVYALPEHQSIVRIQVEAGTTIERAVELSGLMRTYPDIRDRPLSCAIFGRVVPVTQPVGADERIEILRPLLIDPKENRRQAAAKAKRSR